MGTQSRPADTDLIYACVRRDLEEQPGSFDFFQAVRLLKLMLPAPEAVRFHANPSLAFPSAQIAALELSGDGGPAELSVNFLGLVGPMGVLPYFYSELANDRARAKDPTLTAFLDIFHQRLLSLFYEAWQKHRSPVLWERSSADGVSSALRALLGIRGDGLSGRQHISDQALFFYTGLLSIQSRPANALEQILAGYFQVQAEIVQFSGVWCMLPEAQQCRLGSETAFEQLGKGALVGDAVWDQQSKVRVRLGPMPLVRYREFLPGGAAHRKTEALTEFFSNRQYDFELQLVLAGDEVPDFQLGLDLPLGWCSWLKTEEFQHNPDDAVLPVGQQRCI